MREFKIDSNNCNLTVEKFFKKILNKAPLSLIYKTIRKKDIKVNGIRVDGKYILKENDCVQIYLPENVFDSFRDSKTLKPSDSISHLIIYEDSNLLVINKPRGLLVQGDQSGDKSLDIMVREYLLFKKESSPLIASPVHRLDRNTSGIIIFSKKISFTQQLVSIFSKHDLIEKTYFALVKGKLEGEGIISKPLIKNEKIKKVFVDTIENGAKEAITKYNVIWSNELYSFIKINLLTGRTHQIRVHFASIGHPIVGDEKYGNFSLNKEFEKKYHFKKQFLHAGELTFKQLPNELLYLNNKTFKCNLPDEEIQILELIK